MARRLWLGRPGADREVSTRHRLAVSIVSISVVGILLASGVAIYFATDADRTETTRLVFTSVLPLLGTWVGTVLAFYFARENLQAATDSTIRLARRAEPQTPVTQVMIPTANIDSYNVAAGDDPEAIRLSDLYARMQSKGRHRIPILSPSSSVLYVVHDSTIAGFADTVNKDPAAPAQFIETMGDLLRNDTFKKMVTAIGFVGANAVLADVRVAMRSVEGCNDVFVTTGGKAGDPVMGWVTNTDLAKLE
jgi:hypothetical protein